MNKFLKIEVFPDGSYTSSEIDLVVLKEVFANSNYANTDVEDFLVLPYGSCWELRKLKSPNIITVIKVKA